MENLFWKLQEDVLKKEDFESLISYILSDKRFTQFKKVREFEEAYSRWQGCKYSVFVNSGSSANLLLVNCLKEMYGWKDGDEVILSPVTWSTNIAPVIQSGLKPIFVDINLKDLSFDYSKLNGKISDRTRGIFITHLIGFPANLERIKNVIAGRNIALMEDCCESQGATVEEGKVGNIGVASTFSSYWGHHMTTIEGGFICTDDKALYHKLLLKRSHGLARELPKELHEDLKKEHKDIDFNFLFLTDGFNFRSTELNAIIGISQLKRLDEYIRIRRRNYNIFLDMCRDYDDLILLDEEGTSSFCLPFIFRNSVKMEEFKNLLKERGIEARPMIGGNLLRQPFLKKYRNELDDFPNADFIHDNSFYIGNNQFVDERKLDALRDIMAGFFHGNREATYQVREEKEIQIIACVENSVLFNNKKEFEVQ